ncbi:ArpU family phage packaging/lysis transcriptional regulator [Paenibacillus alba]|uniref:ArpU family phage packaging/lysis transcriptional regulator n=1 Tax=Paenibacillus alba TaxID=1197127 RepID=A0ABU6G378_9BACL|nr:ArpU family phage packaging/lysis transcriptional regulator [Paenibacillus alba]MEC0228055.1 ArpU family phage packaging/lysis transcriptional regulator [Paenibacillus alba]
MVNRILHKANTHIDQKTTRKRVERVLELVRMFRSIGGMRRERDVVMGSQSDLITAEMPGLYEADPEAYIASVSAEVEEAVSRLELQEQELIRKRYLQKDKKFDFLLFHELNVSERTYRRIKAKAMSKLAYMLRLEVESRSSDAAERVEARG